MSLPSRERGLKFAVEKWYGQRMKVAPFSGAWIEIRWFKNLYQMLIVAPFSGAWIEISTASYVFANTSGSLPSRERGLKYLRQLLGEGFLASLPSRERELKLSSKEMKPSNVCRSLRGSVD